ncbi:MAG: glycosyltransferase family 87 protein [Myxococcota bacterium]|nr:glycosyltransferase family 87 protein [Myxococcota bacterium]
MTTRHFAFLGILGILPWLLWQGLWPTIVIEQLDHCPIAMCDFQRHYLPQAEVLLDKPLKIVRGWFYPPLLAIGLLPFVWSGKAIWLWGALLFIGLGLLTRLSLQVRHRKPLPFTMTFLFICSSLPVLHGLKWGQISLVLVVLSIFGLTKGGKLGGALIGSAAAIKGYPFVYLLHPLLRKKAMPVLSAAIAFLILGVLLPFAVLGVEESERFYLNMSKSSQFVVMGASESGGQALQSALKRWFIDGTHVGRMETQPIMRMLPELTVSLIWLLLAGLLAALTIKRTKDHNADPIPSVCLILCFIGLMLPPGWHHYFAFLPYAQLQLLQYKPTKQTVGLVIVSIATERLPVMGLGVFPDSYALASSYGCTAFATLVIWMAWTVHLSPNNGQDTQA